MKRSSFKKIIIAIAFMMLAAVISVIAISAEGTIETDATYSGVQVSTAGNVSLRFYYSDLGSADYMVVKVTAPDKSSKITEIEATSVPKVTVNNKELYCVKVPLTPAQMTNTVEVYAKDENGDGAVKTYSVLQYANDVLASDAYSDYHSAMRAMLNWGAMAQNTFNKWTDSLANENIYSNGTNPINGVTTQFYTGKGEVTSGSTITGHEYSITLNEGNTSLNFYVKYSGSETLSATVSKDGGTPDNTDVENVGSGIYAVRINNVGVAVYDKPYTVTITDGSDTFTATKTVLENLNTLSFATGENAKYNDIAKSMYQFYILARNKTSAGSCKHAASHCIASKSTSIVECSACFTTQGTVPFYSDASAINNGTYNSKTDFREFTNNSTKDAIKFTKSLNSDGSVRLHNMTVNTTRAAWAWTRFNFCLNWGWTTAPSVENARYLVIKYRMGNTTGDQTLDIYAANGNTASSNLFQANAIADEQWHTVVIDLYNTAYDGTDATKLNHNTENQTVSFSFLQIQPFGEQREDDTDKGTAGDSTCPQKGTQSAEAYIDFAYIAICDEFSALSGIIDQPIYNFNDKTYITNGIGVGGTELTVEFISTAETINSKTYKDNHFKENPAGAIKFDSTLNDGYVRINNMTVSTTRDKWAWTRFNIFESWSGKSVTNARYLVIKYRMGNTTGDQTLDVYAANTSNASGNLFQANAIADEQWHTVVIDLYNTKYNGTDATKLNHNTENQTVSFSFLQIQPFGTQREDDLDKGTAGDSACPQKGTQSADAYIDFAYIAACDQYSDLLGIIDQDTYSYRPSGATSDSIYNTSEIGDNAPTS